MQINYDQLETSIRSTGLSVQEFCRRANVDRSILVRWKSGETSPRQSTLSRIEHALESLSALADGAAE